MAMSVTPSIGLFGSAQQTVTLGNGQASSAVSSSTTSSDSNTVARAVSTAGSIPTVILAISPSMKTSAESYSKLKSASQTLSRGLGNVSEDLDSIGSKLDSISANTTLAQGETLSSYDRAFLQVDTNNLLSEINQIASTSEYNDANVLDGSMSSATPLTINLTLSDTGETTVAIESADTSNLLSGNTIDLSSIANAETAETYVEDAITVFNAIDGAVKGTKASIDSTATQLGELSGAINGTVERLQTFVNPVDTAAEGVAENLQAVSGAVSAVGNAGDRGTLLQAVNSSSDNAPLQDEDTQVEDAKQNNSNAEQNKKAEITAQQENQRAQSVQPVQTEQPKPVEKPVVENESKPVEVKVAESIKPVEIKPIEVKQVEVKPVEVKVVETKPVEVKQPEASLSKPLFSQQKTAAYNTSKSGGSSVQSSINITA